MEGDKSEIHHNGDIGGKNADDEVQEVAVIKNGTPSKKKNDKAKSAAENEATVLERRKSLRTRANPKKYNEEDNSDFEIEETFNYIKERDPLAVEITRVQKNFQKSTPKTSRKSNELSKTQVGLKSQVTISPAVPVSLVPRVKQQAGFVLVDTQSILTGKGPVALSSVPASITVSSVPAKKSSNAKNSSKNSNSNSATSATVVDPFEQLGLDEKSFIVEAPSFVIPYLIEKPAENSLKNELAKSAVELDSEGSSPKKPKNEDKSSMKSEMQQFANEDYFSSPIGKFFLDIGLSLVQGFVQEDVLRVQKRKTQKGGQAADPSLQVEALEKGLEVTRAKNSDLMLKTRQCDRCNFQTESALVMAYHWTSPLTKGHGAIPTYLCHYCDFKIAPGDHPSPAHAIAFHLEQDHGIRARIEPEGSSLHQCPLCPFEDSMKGKVTRHIVSCQKRFLPGKNLEPPRDWEPPAKVAKINPRVANSSSLYPLLNSMAGGGISQNSALSSYHPLLPKSVLNASAATLAGLSMLTNEQLAFALRATQGSSTSLQLPPELQVLSSSKVYRNQTLGGQSLYSLALGGNQILQQLTKKQNVAMSVLPGSSSTGSSSSRTGLAGGKGGGSSSVSVIGGRGATTSFSTNQQPSISITALPRLANNNPLPVGLVSGATASKDEITCEICDSNIKDLEQLRHHMQWIHKVKIHPKMIHNRPPLNCQKCQCRFFTDQGLERHLLGSHGLVTSSMQEAANKGQDGGRCPICGRVHQWKLLSHVVKDHGLTLKPAHLSYKCTVCTATFGMYKLFESHVYTAHSVVAKKVLDKNATGSEGSASSSQLNNDEITVTPTCQNCQSAGEKCDNCRSSGSKRTVDVIDLSDDDDDDADKKKAVNSKSQVTITKVPSPAKRVRKDEETN